MKNKSFNHEPYYFFRRQIPGEDPHAMLELVIPHSQPERNKDLFENILRWEDDGGRIVEELASMIEQLSVQPVRPPTRS